MQEIAVAPNYQLINPTNKTDLVYYASFAGPPNHTCIIFVIQKIPYGK